MVIWSMRYEFISHFLLPWIDQSESRFQAYLKIKNKICNIYTHHYATNETVCFKTNLQFRCLTLYCYKKLLDNDCLLLEQELCFAIVLLKFNIGLICNSNSSNKLFVITQLFTHRTLRSHIEGIVMNHHWRLH